MLVVIPTLTMHALSLLEIPKIIGHPSTCDFIKIVEKHLLPNYAVTCQDILAAEHIFHKDLGSLKGKTAHQQTPPVNITPTTIPTTVLKQYHDIIMAADIMYVNKIPFFMSISRHLCFATAQHLSNQKSTTILQSIKQIQQVYL